MASFAVEFTTGSPWRGGLFAEHEALDAIGFAGHWVAADQCGAHLGVAGGGFEFAGHAGEEAVEDQVFFDADDAVVGAAHADVGLVGGAAGEDAFVGGGNVGVGAEDGGDAAVEMPAHGDFFAGGFGVEVEEDDLGLSMLLSRMWLAAWKGSLVPFMKTRPMRLMTA